LLGGEPRLFQHQRHDLWLGAAISGGDRGAQHRLRQDALSEFEEWLVRRLGQGFQRLFVTLADTLRQRAQLRHAGAVLEGFKVAENRLLDQPVRGAVDLARSLPETVASRLVQLDAEGGSGHGCVLVKMTGIRDDSRGANAGATRCNRRATNERASPVG